MTNFKWLLKENMALVEKCLASNNSIAINNNGNIDTCHDTACRDCIFYNCGLCDLSRKEKWLKEEHNLYTIPLDTPIDTKVLVSDRGEVWHRRYFAGFGEDEKEPYLAFPDGASSWSSESSGTIAWRYCKLAEGSEK